MSWFGWGKSKKPKDEVQEESERPRRKQNQQRAAPAAHQIPPQLMYENQLKQLKGRGYTDEAVLLDKLKIYGGDVNSVLMELDLEKTQSSSASAQQSPGKPAAPPQTAAEDATEADESPRRKSKPSESEPPAPAVEEKTQASTVELSENLRGCVASQIRQILIRACPQGCDNAIERMYSQSVNGARVYELTPEEISKFGFASHAQWLDILVAAEKLGPPKVQTVSATDVDEKTMSEAASEFNTGDTVHSQLGFGKVVEVRDDGIIVVTLQGQTKGYFAPDALTLSPDHRDFESGEIVMSPMGRSKVMRLRQGDGMVVVLTPTGSEGYFHPSSLEKLESKFFLPDQLPFIKEWTAATVKEAVGLLYPEVAERLYSASVNGRKLIALDEDDVLHITKLGNDFNAPLWDRVAATLGLHSMHDVEADTQGMAKTGAVGDLQSQLAWNDLQTRQENVLARLGSLDEQVAELSGEKLSTPKSNVESSSVKQLKKRRPSGPTQVILGDKAGQSLAKQQIETMGRVADMMTEIDRLTLSPQLFQLRERQAKTVKKLSGMLSSLPNGIQLVREAEMEARRESFKVMDDEKAFGVDGPVAALVQRQNEVYERLVAAGNSLQEIAKQRGVKLPPFNPKPLPPFDIASSSLENLIVGERPEPATEPTMPKTEAKLYDPREAMGGAKGTAGDPLARAVDAESKDMDDTLTIKFRVNKGKEQQTAQMPLSQGQKSVTVGGVRRAIQESLGGKIVEEVRRGKKKILQDDDELNVGRKRMVEVNVFTTDYEV